MKNITTFEDLYSFIKDTLMGAEYEREIQVFGVTCDCYGNGMSINDYRMHPTKDGICLSIQEGGLYEFVLAFWHINYTQNDQCFGLRFVIEPSETAWMTHEGILEAMREFCWRYEDPDYISQEMINNDPELRFSGFQPTVYEDLESLQALAEYVGVEKYEPSPEELDAQLESLEEACRDPYSEIYKGYIHESDVTPVYCNIISAMVCYMNGEFTREQTIASIMGSTDNNKDVKEHLEIILPHLDKSM